MRSSEPPVKRFCITLTLDSQCHSLMQALQVAAGGMHTVALADDGTVWSWGVNDEGALGRQTAGELWEKASERVGGGWHAVLRKLHHCASLRSMLVIHGPLCCG